MDAVMYLRLSREDAGGDAESRSIANQRELICGFARERGLNITGEYVDDGFSGTRFDRPAFLDLLADIDAGKVFCVITKEFARL